MSATSRARSIIGIACLSAALACCAATPKNPYPMLPAPGKLEQNLDCAGLEDQIEKADAIRWSIRESGVNMPATSGQDALVAVAWIAQVASFAGGPPVIGGNPGNKPVYSLTRADARIEKLLAMKRDRSCPANSTGAAGVTDLDALARLENLARSYSAKQLKEKEFLQERTTVFDSLRDPASLQPPSQP